MRLTEEERHTAVWLKLVAHYEKELEHLRARNETYLPHEERLVVVTRIREILNLLALASPAPEPVVIDAYIPI